MSQEFIENALTRLRDDSELVALRADKVRLTAEVRCLEAAIRSHERVDCLIVENLKSEVNRLHTAIRVKDEENARLKAEFDLFMTNPTSRLLRVSRAECEILKAEVERLRKAGTEMGKHLLNTDDANRAYNAFEEGISK